MSNIQQQLAQIPILQERIRGLQRLQEKINEINREFNQFLEEQQIDDSWVINQQDPMCKWNHIKTYLTQVQWQIINNNNQMTTEKESIKETRQQVEDLRILIWDRIGKSIEQQAYFQKINQLKDQITYTDQDQYDITNFEYI